MPEIIRPLVSRKADILLYPGLSILLLACAYYFVMHAAYFLGHAIAFDWNIFVNSAKAYISTGRLYEKGLWLYGPGAAIYKFPPFFLSIVIFFFQNGVSAESLWFWNAMIHIALYICTGAIILLSLKRHHTFLLYLLAAIFLLSFEAFFDNFLRLQLEIYVVFLVSLGIFFLNQRRYFASGFCLGISVGLKIYPAFFCIGLITRRDYRSLVGLLAGFFSTAAISLTTINSSEHWHYFTQIMPHMLSENMSLVPDNISITHLLMLLGCKESITRYIATSCLILAIVIVVSGVIFYEYTKNISKNNTAAINEDPADAFRIASGFSVLVAGFVVGAQNSWWNYQLLLMIPIITSMVLLMDKRYFNWLGLFAIFLSALLIYCGSNRNLPGLMTFISSVTGNRNVMPSMLLTSVYLRTVASMLVYIASAGLYWRVLREQAK